MYLIEAMTTMEYTNVTTTMTVLDLIDREISPSQLLCEMMYLNITKDTSSPSMLVSDCAGGLGGTIFQKDITSSNGEKEEDTQYRELYIKLRFITGLILYPIFCFFGLSGNILSLIVLSHKKMRSSTNTYLQALAVSDSIKLINDLFYFLTILFMTVNPNIGNNMYGYLYPYAHYFFNMSVCITAWITVSVAAERYILVCHATKAKSICNLDRSRVISLAVFLVMTVVTIPLGLRYRTIELYNNETNSTYLDVEVTPLWKNKQFVTYYQWAQNFLRSVIPLLILIVLNYFIIQALRRTRSTKKKMSSRHRITLMLVSVIIVFLICVTPDAIMSTFFGFGYYEANFLARAVREITDLLLLINSAVNFILYCTFNKLFRRRFVDIFCQCRYWPSRKFMARTTDDVEYRHTSLASTFKQTMVGLNGSGGRNSRTNKNDPETPPLFQNEELCGEENETVRSFECNIKCAVTNGRACSSI